MTENNKDLQYICDIKKGLSVSPHDGLGSYCRYVFYKSKGDIKGMLEEKCFVLEILP